MFKGSEDIMTTKGSGNWRHSTTPLLIDDPWTWTLTNIRINLILPKTGLRGKHPYRWQC